MDGNSASNLRWTGVAGGRRRATIQRLVALLLANAARKSNGGANRVPVGNDFADDGYIEHTEAAIRSQLVHDMWDQ